MSANTYVISGAHPHHRKGAVMYRHILGALGDSEPAECVLPHVAAVATGCSVTRVTLARVVTPLKMGGGIELHISPEERHRLEQDSMEVATRCLEERAQTLREQGLQVECETLFGNVVDELVDLVTKHEVELIVIATHRRSGVSRLFRGGVADRVLRTARVPVLMVRAPGSEAHTRR